MLRSFVKKNKGAGGSSAGFLPGFEHRYEARRNSALNRPHLKLRLNG